MKKSIILLVLILTGCASLPPAARKSSNCIYEVDGLKCEREVVYSPRDGYGLPYYANHTLIWFDNIEECRDFINDSENEEFLSENPTLIRTCGILEDGRATIEIFYTYTDNIVDGDFYYVLTEPMSIKVPNSKRDELFTPIFTSRSALNKFKQEFDERSFNDPVSLNLIKRMKIKKKY